MVWGGVSLTNKTQLVQTNGNLNFFRYVNEIRCPQVAPPAVTVGRGFVLVDDNARPHRAQGEKCYRFFSW